MENEKRKALKKIFDSNLRKKYVKVKDLNDILNPKYRRMFGLRVEIHDKLGNPKFLAVASPDIVEKKVYRKRKRKEKNWVRISSQKLRYGAEGVLSYNKEKKLFKVNIFYKTLEFYMVFPKSLITAYT
ncbi:MAG: hypothetical protein QXP36_07500 [Conexivisphaerales archaeon]